MAINPLLLPPDDRHPRLMIHSTTSKAGARHQTSNLWRALASVGTLQQDVGGTLQVGIRRWGIAALTPRIGRPFHMNKNDRLSNQRRAELLRRRIEELNQQLATLNSERGRFERLLDGFATSEFTG